MNSDKVKNCVTLSLMTAMLCVFSPFVIVIPISPIPISLANFVIYMSIIIFEFKKTFICILMYLIIGFVGLPVFSGFRGGAAVILGPTGGYLIGYLALALVAGLLLKIIKENKLSYIISLFVGTIFLYLIGTVWLSFVANMAFGEAFVVGVMPFFIFDIIKIVVSSIFGPKVKNIISKIL